MKIGKLIKVYRTINDIGVRAMAKEIGVGASTISRLENGIGLPDCIVTIKLIKWLFERKGLNK